MIKLHQLAPGAPYDDTTMTAESSEMPKKRQMLDEEYRNRCFLCYSRVTRRVLVLNRVKPRRFAQVLSTLKLTPELRLLKCDSLQLTYGSPLSYA